jgi:hypothetical protein
MRGRVTSGGYVRRQLTFELGDLILEVQLAFLEALQLKLVLDSALGEAGYDVIEVSVLQVQLIDTLAEHLTVGGMYHGLFLHTDLTRASIDRKKPKNEAVHPAPARCAGPRSDALYFRKLDIASAFAPGLARRPECRSR